MKKLEEKELENVSSGTNYGGAIYNTDRDISIQNSSFSKNNSHDKNNGGAIYNENNTIDNCKIVDCINLNSINKDNNPCGGIISK